MRRPLTSALLLLAACGARLSDSSRDGADAALPPDAAASDAGLDAAPFGAWSPAAPVMVAATTAVEDDVTLTSDALEMVFAVAGPAGTSAKDLYYTSRTSTDTPWTQAVKLPFDTAASEEAPRFSGDNKTLYFASDRVTSGDLDIYAVTHSAAGSTMWGLPRPVTAVNTGATEKWFAPCGTDRYVIVRSTTNNGTDLFEGTLSGGSAAPLDILNSPQGDTGAFLTQDCLTIYFASFRETPEKIFVSHRASVTAPWDPPTRVDDFKATAGNQEDPWLSADKRTFVFASDAAAGNKDIYLSTR
jgi:Tol biopolymer transport system component